MDEPPDAAIPTGSQRALRLAVAHFRRSETRRSFPPVVHVGRPGEASRDFVEAEGLGLDQALRTEVAAALLSRALNDSRCPTLWLTRAGELGIEDVDLRWYAAARAAYAEAAVALTMVVITRAGWSDVRTGARREWKRLRIRS